ncbi:MAG: uracil-DNA glycosylase [Candidatus Margulisiibacteriota bacterium]
METCTACRHFYITWDATFPYGCRALGFKSKHVPYHEVRTASDLACQFFKEKTSSNKETT